MKNQMKVLLAVLGALAMSACGKSNFNGTYTGYETGMNGASPATLVLKEDGGSVTGTYTVTQTQSMFGGQAGGSQSGQLTASAEGKDSLTNVTLIMSTTTPAANNANGQPWSQPLSNNTGSMSGGFFTGSLASANDGRQLSGTLTQQGMGMMMQPQPGIQNQQGNGKTVSLTRSGKN